MVTIEDKKKSRNEVNKAIDIFGSPKELADALNIAVDHIYAWRSVSKKKIRRMIPIGRANRIIELVRKRGYPTDYLKLEKFRPDMTK